MSGSEGIRCKVQYRGFVIIETYHGMIKIENYFAMYTSIEVAKKCIDVYLERTKNLPIKQK